MRARRFSPTARTRFAHAAVTAFRTLRCCPSPTSSRMLRSSIDWLTRVSRTTLATLSWLRQSARLWTRACWAVRGLVREGSLRRPGRPGARRTQARDHLVAGLVQQGFPGLVQRLAGLVQRLVVGRRAWVAVSPGIPLHHQALGTHLASRARRPVSLDLLAPHLATRHRVVPMAHLGLLEQLHGSSRQESTHRRGSSRRLDTIHRRVTIRPDSIRHPDSTRSLIRTRIRPDPSRVHRRRAQRRRQAARQKRPQYPNLERCFSSVAGLWPRYCESFDASASADSPTRTRRACISERDGSATNRRRATASQYQRGAGMRRSVRAPLLRPPMRHPSGG